MRQRGFSLLELMVVAAVFTIITGAVFTVLIAAEQRYKTESDLSSSFQSANVAMDQMVRDIHQAGYPPANTFAGPPAPAPLSSQYALPFAWDPGYPTLPACTVGGSCTPTPSGFDIIVETIPDQATNGAVQWIRYQLPAGSHTLLRAVVPKAVGTDPVAATQDALIPYLDGVMNNATPAEIAQIQASYPNMFPGGTQQPIFNYFCDGLGAAGPQLCATNAPNNTALNIREVQITLIVESATKDLKTGQPRIVTLTGQADRINPNQ